MTIRMKFCLLRLAILVVLLSVPTLGSKILAAEKEFRNYLSIDYTTVRGDAGSLRLALSPYLTVENRFRDGNLVYQQWNLGSRLNLLSWLGFQAYYTPRELMYPGKSRANKDVAGFDVLLNPSYGPFRLLDRMANEWHMTDRFYRYRNFTDIIYKSPVRWIALDAFEEFRADSDQQRINQNDLGAGLQLLLNKSLSLRAFYDLEASRRQLPEWHYVSYIGVSIGAHL